MKENKTVIYTAIFGGKDNLIEPKAVSKNCDYICFTDTDFKSEIWRVRKVEPPVKDDPVRSARKYKILPHRFLSEYEYSVWVDGNLLIRGDLSGLIDRYLRGTNMAVFDHANYKWNPGHTKLQIFLNIFRRDYPYVRHCVYEEGEELIKMNAMGAYKDDSRTIRDQLDKYRGEGYPENNTLIQSSVLVRRHNAPDVVKAMEDWWREVKYHSRRDQLSFNYVAWKNKFNFVYMKGDPRKNKYFLRLAHKRKKNYK